jgi:hypothetical protein
VPRPAWPPLIRGLARSETTMPVGRLHEIDLSERASLQRREDAMRLLAELQEMGGWLRDLRDGLMALLERASPHAKG